MTPAISLCSMTQYMVSSATGTYLSTLGTTKDSRNPEQQLKRGFFMPGVGVFCEVAVGYWRERCQQNEKISFKLYVYACLYVYWWDV